jgi:hypothetical protein
MSERLEREWYRCPQCAAEYRTENARDACVDHIGELSISDRESTEGAEA